MINTAPRTKLHNLLICGNAVFAVALDLVDVGRAVGGEICAVNAGATEGGDRGSYWVGQGGCSSGVGARYGDVGGWGKGVC